ncbi:MAG: flagellin [Phycisphaerales bacterium]|jgi:flagellin-like hook-associated protein FlgL
MQPIGIGSSPVNTGLRILGLNQAERNSALERLSTGLRINRASDDPAGLMSSEAIGAALKSLEAESRSLDRSQSVINSAEGAIAEISGLLIEAEGLAVTAANTAGLSETEREALQVELDSILQTVDRLAGGAEFNGQKLLDGTFRIPLGDGAFESVAALDPSKLGEVYDIEPEVTETGEVIVDPDAVKVNMTDLASGGAGSLLENPGLAQRILGAAREQVNTQLGALGALSKNAIAPRLASIGVQIESLSSARSLIRDADFAEESARLIRANIRTEATLGAISAGLLNQERVLDLLG